MANFAGNRGGGKFRGNSFRFEPRTTMVKKGSILRKEAVKRRLAKRKK